MRQTRPPSIARRIYHAMLLVSFIGMLVMTGIVSYISEDLEDSILALEMQRERQFILANHDPATPLFWDSTELIAVYLPNGQTPPAHDLPALFRDIAQQYSAEVEADGQTWLLSAAPTETGQWYLAKNITHFEDRETLFEQILFAVALAIMGLSLLAAAWSSRRLIRPLRHLSQTIADTPVGPTMPRIAMDSPHDAELHAIAATFNRFLDEMEAYVRRERELLRMAGHELRTPIAVVSGALDVLESRGQLHAQDHVTLTRARRACHEMRDNVNTLLALARRGSEASSNQATDPSTRVNVSAIVQHIADDLNDYDDHPRRLILALQSPCIVQSDPAMVRMLLHNLMQNAIQHTRGDVHVRVNADAIDVTDQGAGLDAQAQAVLHGSHTLAGDDVVGGLGLYIVTLMCERLGWTLRIVHTGAHGTRIRLMPLRTA